MTEASQLSRVRSFLFGALALVWFSEMLLWGIPSLSTIWASLWRISPPADPQLATALSATLAVEAPVKGALCALAVFGLRSRDPSTRTALFASMALVPPLNTAFPFRQQGFLPGPVAVGTILSAVLWGSFFLFRERSQPPAPERSGASGRMPPSRWEVFRHAWVAANSAALTLLALLLLFWPRTALHLVFPCLSGLMSAEAEGLSSLIHKSLGSGTHLVALATASWIATVNWRSNPALRQAVATASALNAGLFLAFPIRRIGAEFGGACATSSILVAFVPLLAGWALYAAAAHRARPLDLSLSE